MALRIANNIAAMNTQRWLGVSDTGMKKSLERLSSGYRINRAADDAAGLAISQSFRADIASFKVASRNTSEASSLLQVGEGAMDQIGNMLTRLKELATQAASANAATNVDKIEAEKSELLTEIDRIANVTEYAGSKLIDGSFGAVAGTLGGAVATDANSYTIETTNYFKYTFTDGGTTPTITLTAGTKMDAGTWQIDAGAGATTVSIGNGSVTESAAIADGNVIFENLGLTLDGASALTTTALSNDSIAVVDTGISATSVASTTSAGTYTITDTSGSIEIGNGTVTQTESASAGATVNFDQLGIKITLDSAYDDGDLDDLKFNVTSTGSSTFQVGSGNTANDRIDISLGNATATGLGVNGISLATASDAQSALDTIDSAIDDLATIRGNVGAAQNRLAYAASNLATTIENVQAAESVIRDVDMASEMTDFTKNQILLQAGTAMLAQANMAPQQVLALFG